MKKKANFKNSEIEKIGEYTTSSYALSELEAFENNAEIVLPPNGENDPLKIETYKKRFEAILQDKNIDNKEIKSMAKAGAIFISMALSFLNKIDDKEKRYDTELLFILLILAGKSLAEMPLKVKAFKPDIKRKKGIKLAKISEALNSSKHAEVWTAYNEIKNRDSKLTDRNIARKIFKEKAIFNSEEGIRDSIKTGKKYIQLLDKNKSLKAELEGLGTDLNKLPQS